MQEPRPAGIGDEPDADEPGHEGRRVGGDAHVARDGEREPSAGRRTVDRGDHRLLERADGAHVRVVGLLQRVSDRARQLAELADVLTGAERLAGTRDDDRADGRVGRLAGECGVQLTRAAPA